MRVYSSDGKYILDPNKEEKINYGTYGNIYKLDDNTCYKVFKHEGIHKPEPIITLKELQLDNFYKIIDLLYDRHLKYTGYIMSYHEKDNNIDILADKDYLVGSVNSIYKGILELTKRMIQVNDLHIDNILVTKDGLTIIDIDDYKKFNTDNTYINVFRFKEVLKTLLYDYIKRYDVTDIQEAYMLLKRLIDIDHTDINHFNNVMKRYNKPIDYFAKVIK